MVKHIEDYNKIVANRDDAGRFRIRVDYMSNGDKTDFFIDGNKEFVVSKKLLHRGNKHLMYVITVENTGIDIIDNTMSLYSGSKGLFPRYSILQKHNVGNEAALKSIKPGEKVNMVFFTWQITEREEAIRLINEIPNNYIYGNKVLSVFERLHSDLRDDYELFQKGLRYSPHVVNYASPKLKQRIINSVIEEGCYVG